jgi:hypothetical protein
MDYQKLYDELILKARSENRVKVKGGTYYEAHHIIPKCLGGEGTAQQWRTHPNIILLTAKEHFMAHYYLTKTHPENFKLSFAFWGMCNQVGGHNQRDYSEVLNFSELYEEARIRHSINFSTTQRGRSKPQGFGKKVSVANMGKKISPESRAKMSAAKEGRKLSPEHIAKRTAAQIKPIQQYTKNGEWIRDWSSCKEASETLGISNISSCLTGKIKSSGGFVWRHKS